MAENTSNALGLDFSQETVEEKPEYQEPEQSSQTVAPDSSSRKEQKEKPYVNPERVKTGGSQRDKLSDEALEERMARIRQQNEKIKQRRIDVQADEAAFRQTQERERERQMQNRKIQSEIDRARDQNAQRKMAKVQSREWDSGKPSRNINPPSSSQTDAAPQQGSVEDETAPSPTIAQEPSADSGNWVRGGPHQRGRGRGRGRGSGRGGGNFNNRRDTPQSATSAHEEPKQEADDQVAPTE
ncbi:hypothetical protein JR316_0003334 [Psilocybe cubensis]|uniref:Uncharacterized protein n=2 Tax=Psilocybe cubensis TaxID=181762 RepID=A0ACB8H7K5_PSICU|nr:hypothetical protein JR316_0003334 [Psilocybe cubensis]KAH9483856.1 hypothetical protein JR316_0003334 [Psilocybe cubensis]